MADRQIHRVRAADLKQEYHVDLTFETKRKILDENAARLYGIDIAAQIAKLSPDAIALTPALTHSGDRQRLDFVHQTHFAGLPERIFVLAEVLFCQRVDMRISALF